MCKKEIIKQFKAGGFLAGICYRDIIKNGWVTDCHAEENEAIEKCLITMFYLNNRNREEKDVYYYSCFLDNTFGTKFKLKFDTKRQTCSLTLSGYCEYTSVNFESCMNCPPLEPHLFQSREKINDLIKKECEKLNLNLNELICKAAFLKIIREDLFYFCEEKIKWICKDKRKLKDAETKFKNIMNGDAYEPSINYNGEADVFIAVLQMLMYKTDFDIINSRFTMCEQYNEKASPEEKKAYIEDEIKTLCHWIETKKILNIKRLILNNKYSLLKSVAFELFNSARLDNGIKLIDKIEAIFFSDLGKKSVMLLQILLHVGYMDWNTIHAIRRINLDFRPEFTNLQNTIDKAFLEVLFKKYGLR